MPDQRKKLINRFLTEEKMIFVFVEICTAAVFLIKIPLEHIVISLLMADNILKYLIKLILRTTLLYVADFFFQCQRLVERWKKVLHRFRV